MRRLIAAVMDTEEPDFSALDLGQIAQQLAQLAAVLDQLAVPPFPSLKPSANGEAPAHSGSVQVSDSAEVHLE